MSRNTDSHFGNAPMKDIRRSAFKRPFTHSTTFNTGEIIPILADEVLPGDTCKMHTASLVRMTTPINPVMDNAWLDTYYFFIPRRLVWEHWKEFMGENNTDAWTQETEYSIPQLEIPSGGWQKGTLGEKLYGIQGREGSVDACYARAYVLTFNEWFRNQNITEPAELSKGDATTTGSNGTDYVVDMQKGGQLAKAVKYADYFTRALPEPQKGPDIYLPLGLTAPLTGTGKIDGNIGVLGDNGKALNFTSNNGSNISANLLMWSAGGYTGLTTGASGTEKTITDTASSLSDTLPAGHYVGLRQNASKSGITTNSDNWPVKMDDVSVDLSQAQGATINQLRQAFAIQKMYEIDARGGRAKACASSIKKSRKKTGRLNQKAS